MNTSETHPAPALRTWIAFSGARCIASGEPLTVAQRARRMVVQARHPQLLIFDAATSEPIDLDLRGSADEMAARIERHAQPRPPFPDETAVASPRGPGRPKLGVVAREVTLLPRHWEWLGRQTGGASVALRKLVEEARRVHAGRDRIRQAQESAYRFMSAMAGNEAGFEEASRALFAGLKSTFETTTQGWPSDVKAHARRLAAVAFDEQAPA